ncbi:MAG: hypothetical protein IIZ23_07290 [Ruminococcus sp.]|nr:hypothetical protein [Ruminococcus sp.]
MSIIISVNPPYSALLVDGIKKIEWRKRFLPRGKAFIYETKKHGGIGAVIGEVEIVGEYWCVANAITPDDISRGCVDAEHLLAYANGEVMLAANFAENGIRYKETRPLSDFGLKRPPQSWCYVEGL